jgi:iron(III) transport system substrate-binding protein
MVSYKRLGALGVAAFLALAACSSGGSSGGSTGNASSSTPASQPASGSASQGSGNSSGVDAKGVVVRKDGESYDAYIQRLYEAAQKEGSVVYYQTSGQSELDHIQTQWKAMFPKVELKPVTARSGSIVQRALTEARAGKVQGDTINGTIQDLAPLVNAGGLQDYVPAGFDNVPKQYQFPGPYVANFFLTRNVTYNTQKVKAADLPTDYMGYCDAKWKGEITFDPSSSGVVAGLIQAWGKDKVVQFLQCLSKNDVKLVPGTTAGTQQVASGEVEVKLDGMGHITKKFEKGGSPITAQVPNPDPLVVLVGLSAILKGAPHPNAAQLYQEFMVSPEGGEKAEALEGKPTLGADLLAPDAGPYPEYMKGAKLAIIEPNKASLDLVDQATQLLNQYLVKQ